ncbi:MAG TPA: hypothetical protein VNN18_00760 [Candidatus Xenobia bacterium]|nr:hypothetical protein [Candidatus Xenobia bacterium]
MRRWWTAAGEAGLVCEIAADYVAAVRCAGRGIQAWAAEPLPEGAVQPGPLSENIAKGAPVSEAVEKVLAKVVHGHHRCALLVPDLVARVALLDFDTFPDNPQEADALVRWRLGRDLPFDLKQAVLSFRVQPGQNGKREVLAAVAVHGLIRQYEHCLPEGLEPGWVTLSTLAAGNLLAGAGSPRLLVKRDHGSLGLTLVHRGGVRFFRSLPLAAGEGPLGAASLFDKVFPALVYFQDRWGEAVGEVFWAGPAGEGAALGELLERETGAKVAAVSLTEVDLAYTGGAQLPADRRLLPSLGWARGELQ